MVAGWLSGAGEWGQRVLDRRTSRRWTGALPRGLGPSLIAVIVARRVRLSIADTPLVLVRASAGSGCLRRAGAWIRVVAVVTSTNHAVMVVGHRPILVISMGPVHIPHSPQHVSRCCTPCRPS